MAGSTPSMESRWAPQGESRPIVQAPRARARRSKQVFQLTLREYCQLLLTISARPLHYATIARIIRGQGHLRLTDRELITALTARP